jgi:hypothetical protein
MAEPYDGSLTGRSGGVDAVLERFTIETFAPHLRQTFRALPDAAAPIDMVLTEATPLGSGSGQEAGAPGRRVPFSLVFRGPRDVLLPQRTYRIEHEAIGAFDLFLVPIGPDGEGMRYEAIFT